MFATSSIARHLQGSTEYRMFKIEGDLYLAAPGYRGLVSELRRLKVENGALAAAYQNALNDRPRYKADLNARCGRWLARSNSAIATIPVAAVLAQRVSICALIRRTRATML